ncbi:MAG TPA: ribonuclease J [Fimbriimonadaceae bacterium]|nr:ribonuclease J [Fimbriimonadaceae bacterium]HRJ32441.1 ribonuclease J [Fimbriimonadaceae bacterium]
MTPGLRIIPLGGAAEIGKNCTVVEQGEDIVIIDCGLSFPNEEQYGVDIIVPDFTYLVENRDRIRGLFLTHAHEDHVGALPYFLRQLNVPIYATEFTHAMIRQKLEEKTDVHSLDLRTLKPGDKVACGQLSVEPIRVTHSIPDTMAMAVRTSFGIVLFTADFKLDFTPIDGKKTDMSRLAALADEGVLVLLSDSTNVDRPGWSPSEREVSGAYQKFFSTAPGRILITMFASNIHRMQQAFDVALATGRKVAVAGRRMENTIDVCSRYGHLRVPTGVRIRLDDIGNYRPEQLVILTTGSQGEPMSALVQMSREEYGRMKVLPGDTILYSARPIPGNEAAIWRTVNRLFRLGAVVIYENAGAPIHVSGHAYQEELKTMINLTSPFYLAPVHGEPRHQHQYLEFARKMGYPEHRLFSMADGLPLCFDEERAWLGEPVPSGRMLVDNGGQPGVPDEIMRDRTNLANEGLVMVIAKLDIEKGELVEDLELDTKGLFASEKELANILSVVQSELQRWPRADLQDAGLVRSSISDEMRRHLSRRLKLRPIIVPVVIEV